MNMTMHHKTLTAIAGLIVVAAPLEQAAAAQVFATDLIVQGSECVGVDCSSSESFGFDTIRLKENNLRIKFDDTSNSASFPRNDWQLTANETGNGGLNKFSIDDITGGRTPFTVEAGAITHALYVEADSDVGLGTKDPVVELHIVRGDTPTIRLEQDGSSGFTPQTWDLAGNEANFFIRDVTNGSKLSFKIKPGAPENSLFVAADGDIGMGTQSPDAELDIESDTGPGFRFSNTGTAGGNWEVFMNSGTGRLSFRENGANSPLKIESGAIENLVSIGIDTAGNTETSTVSIGRDVGAEAVLDVQGSIIVDGTVEHPDYVFEPGYELPSIEDQAAFMWEKKHLPALPKAPEGNKGPVDLVGHQMGVLEEVEKAHIYISQLNTTITELQARLDQLEATSTE